MRNWLVQLELPHIKQNSLKNRSNFVICSKKYSTQHFTNFKWFPLCTLQHTSLQIGLFDHDKIIIVYSGVYFLCFAGFFFTLLPRTPRTYASVWIATLSCDWSTYTQTFLLLYRGMKGLCANVTEVQKWEKIHILIQYIIIYDAQDQFW